MLSQEKNELLTRVSAGTPMGELLRRYWWPIAASSEVGPLALTRRLLGEDLVLFRDGGGRLGLLEGRCPHRRASLALGCIEDGGLRCGYHGWVFDRSGACLEQPSEPEHSTFKDRVRAVAYQVQELGGLVFAYLGPDPAPLLPRYDLFVWENVWRDIGHATIPCNFLQIMENSVDPYHVEWLHGRYGSYRKQLAGETPPQVLTKRHVKVAFEPFEHGILKRRVLEGHTEEDEDWKIGHPLVFPGMLRIGGGGLCFFQIRVPIDDTHTWHVWYQCYRPDEHIAVPEQKEIPFYEVPLYDERGEFIDDYVDGQDVVAWVTQGPIAERTRENLCKADAGVIMLRRMFQQQIEQVAKGEDPLGTIRDAAKNRMIELPQEVQKFGSGADFRREFLTMGQTRYSPIHQEVLALFDGKARSANGANGKVKRGSPRPTPAGTGSGR